MCAKKGGYMKRIISGNHQENEPPNWAEILPKFLGIPGMVIGRVEVYYKDGHVSTYPTLDYPHGYEDQVQAICAYYKLKYIVLQRRRIREVITKTD